MHKWYSLFVNKFYARKSLASVTYCRYQKFVHKERTEEYWGVLRNSLYSHCIGARLLSNCPCDGSMTQISPILYDTYMYCNCNPPWTNIWYWLYKYKPSATSIRFTIKFDQTPNQRVWLIWFCMIWSKIWSGTDHLKFIFKVGWIMICIWITFTAIQKRSLKIDRKF